MYDCFCFLVLNYKEYIKQNTTILINVIHAIFKRDLLNYFQFLHNNNIIDSKTFHFDQSLRNEIVQSKSYLCWNYLFENAFISEDSI
jgi:hypothetical protein